MRSMELDDEEKLDTVLPMPMDKPDFPCGLRISLSEKELDKLGLDAPTVEHVGGVVHGHFLGRVTSVSMDQRDGENCCRVEIQIEDLDIESEDEENEAGEDE